jgi:hypothetical protein
MGKRIVYCAGCGRSLSEDEFGKGRASVQDDRPWCSDCRPAPQAPAAAAPPPQKISNSRLPAAPPSTQRRVAAPPKPGPGLWIGLGAGAAVGLALVIALSSGGAKPPVLTKPPDNIVNIPAPKPPPPKPRSEQDERVEREMRERKEKEDARRFDEFLAEIRRTFQKDRRNERGAEIERMLETARKSAGAKAAEVGRLQEEYRAWVADARRRQSLVAHWKLDEGTGLAAADASGNGHDGTLTGGVAWTEGRLGRAAAFDGQDDGVLTAELEGLSPHAGPQGAMTLAAWMRISERPPAAGQGRLPAFSKGSPTAYEYALYACADGRAQFCIWSLGGTGHAELAGGRLELNRWHHVAGVIQKGSFAALYVDGAQVQRVTTFTGETAAGASPVRLGRRGDGQFFKGAVDDVRIYSRVLSDAEVKALAEGREP